MSFDNKSLRCRNCKFWWPVAKEGAVVLRERSKEGQCRRHAPPAITQQDEDRGPIFASWMVTLSDDWCGEHVHVGSGA